MGVHEVGGSVYWVNDERWGGGQAAGCGGFFAQETVEKLFSRVRGCLIYD